MAAVFSFDPVFVTLFYEEGAASRFIRQKIMFNLAPVEMHIKEQQGRLRGAAAGSSSSNAVGVDAGVDVRLFPFVYTYFYGLFVHKLAHFFDIVHGTRHNFFMTEYRAQFALDFIELLERKGFNPDNIEQLEFGEKHLPVWSVVF